MKSKYFRINLTTVAFPFSNKWCISKSMQYSDVRWWFDPLELCVSWACWGCSSSFIWSIMDYCCRSFFTMYFSSSRLLHRNWGGKALTIPCLPSRHHAMHLEGPWVWQMEQRSLNTKTPLFWPHAAGSAWPWANPVTCPSFWKSLSRHRCSIYTEVLGEVPGMFL